MTSTTVHTVRPRGQAVRSGPGIAALVAGAGFVIEGVIAIVHPTADQHWDAASQVLNLSFAVGCLAVALALPAAARRFGTGRIGRAGVVAAQVGFAAMVVESVVSSIHDGNTLGGVFFGGLVLSLLGQLVLGIDGARRRGRRWLAALPFLGMLISIVAGDRGGSIVLGAVWVALALMVEGPTR